MRHGQLQAIELKALLGAGVQAHRQLQFHLQRQRVDRQKRLRACRTHEEGGSTHQATARQCQAQTDPKEPRSSEQQRRQGQMHRLEARASASVCVSVGVGVGVGVGQVAQRVCRQGPS